jgi:hypothetical protein
VDKAYKAIIAVLRAKRVEYLNVNRLLTVEKTRGYNGEVTL